MSREPSPPPALGQADVGPARTTQPNQGPAGLTRPADPPGFDLLDEVGRGGMDVVYRARDVSLDRDVAVKLRQACGRQGLDASSRNSDRYGSRRSRMRHRVPKASRQTALIGGVLIGCRVLIGAAFSPRPP